MIYHNDAVSISCLFHWSHYVIFNELIIFFTLLVLFTVTQGTGTFCSSYCSIVSFSEKIVILTWKLQNSNDARDKLTHFLVYIFTPGLSARVSNKRVFFTSCLDRFEKRRIHFGNFNSHCHPKVFSREAEYHLPEGAFSTPRRENHAHVMKLGWTRRRVIYNRLHLIFFSLALYLTSERVKQITFICIIMVYWLAQKEK